MMWPSVTIDHIGDGTYNVKIDVSVKLSLLCVTPLM